MERFFIIVIEEINSKNILDKWQKDFSLLRDYQNLYLSSLKSPNSANLPQNQLSINWAICVANTQIVYKGSGFDEFQEFISSSFVADIPSEIWDSKAFNWLSNCAIDIILVKEDCHEFWRSFNPSNNIKVFRTQEHASLNLQLFWRGSIRTRDPQNPSQFGQLESAELSFGFDQLDLLTSQIKGESIISLAKQHKKTFCSFLELITVFSASDVPFIFYTSTSFALNIHEADTFWKAMDKAVSLLFRLDYASEEVESREKEIGTQSIYFLSHWTGDELRLFVLKGADQLQSLANVYVGLHSTTAFPFPRLSLTEPDVASPSDHLRMDRLEREIRRMQLLALQKWITENGTIDTSTMNELLNEVALAVAKEHRRFVVKELPKKIDWPEFSEAESLKWKLEKKVTAEGDRIASMGNRLLQPNGRLVTVDVTSMLRCFSKKVQSRSPKKSRPECVSTTRLKPNCDYETARTAQWPKSASLKYHGINYNMSEEDEKGEKQRTEYQDKWVQPEVASSSWCNPWSINSSSSYQLSTRSRSQPIATSSAPARAPRTPKKNQQPPRDLSQLRKSPRLLAKSGGVTRTSKRTPSKKNAAPPTVPKDTFKQQLKAVIIKVLGDQKITTKDPLFRTCANKLSVICMALLKDSKSEVTPRQMYQVAKSQAKQVLQFVKP